MTQEHGGNLEEWNRIAPAYDRTNTPSQMWLAKEALRAAEIGKGMTFLDVAAGSGALSIPAARLGARVVATDQSSIMLDLLRSRAGKENLEVETRVMDGHALKLEDSTFDAVGSQFGVMLFPDMPKGVREMTRVAKPGGRVLLIAYGDPHRIDFLGYLIEAIQSVRPEFQGPPSEPPPLEFQLADPERVRSELTGAGLGNVGVQTIIETTEFPDGDTLWDWIISSNPIVERILGGALKLTVDERTTVREALGKLVRTRSETGGPVRLSNPVNIGIGTKPNS